MWLREIWRYPVKSLAGERLATAALRRDGIAGDRTVLAADASGRIYTARRHARLLRLHATLDANGEPVVNGHPWRSAEANALVEDATEPGVHLVKFERPERFDILPLLVVTDGAIAAFGRDHRRLRPNLVIGGVKGLAEREWEGRRLQVGEAIVRCVDLRNRCIMTTWDPDTHVQDIFVLKDIAERFDGSLGLNTSVEREGTIREGDPVTLLD